MLAVEFVAAIDSDGSTETFIEADGKHVTTALDTPANTDFGERLTNPGTISYNAFGDGKTFGAGRRVVGDIVLDNTDGGLDDWINYSFDGRDMALRHGTSADPYPDDWHTFLLATVQSVEASFRQVVARVDDKLSVFDKPAGRAKYAGNNALPAGLEGTTSDLGGSYKPEGYGLQLNITPRLVNTSRLIFQVRNGAVQSVDAVYVRGSALTLDTAVGTSGVYASQVDMETNAPASGKFAYWPAGGYFRIGSSPDGIVTADVTQGATAAVRTVAQILKQMAIDSGLDPADINSGDVTALDALNSAPVNIYIAEGEKTWLQAMNEVAQSIGAYFNFDEAGELRMGQLNAPSGSPVETLYDFDVGEVERRPPRDVPIPAWRVTVHYARNWTKQNTDLAGAVTDARRAFLAEDYRHKVVEDESIKDKWLTAPELEFFTLLNNEADAAAEAARLFGLYSVRRDIYDVPIDLSRFAEIAIENSPGIRLLSVVRLNLVNPARFNLGGAGRDLRTIGIDFELGEKPPRAVLHLWG